MFDLKRDRVGLAMFVKLSYESQFPELLHSLLRVFWQPPDTDSHSPHSSQVLHSPGQELQMSVSVSDPEVALRVFWHVPDPGEVSVHSLQSPQVKHAHSSSSLDLEFLQKRFIVRLSPNQHIAYVLHSPSSGQVRLLVRLQ